VSAEISSRPRDLHSRDVSQTKKAVAEVIADARPKRFPKPTNNSEYLARIKDGLKEAGRSIDESLESEVRLEAAIRARHAWQLAINHAAFEIRDPLKEEVNS
jgi:hypothetical protein